MRGQVVIGGVQVGLVVAGVLHPGLLVVGHHKLGDPAQELKHADVGADPVRQTPGPGQIDERVVRRTQRSHEHPRTSDLSAAGIHDLEGGAGVIDEELLSPAVGLTQGDLQPVPPAAVEIAELTVLIPIGVGLPVLQPQQLEGDPFPGQLPVHPAPVGKRPGGCGRSRDRKQACFQLGVAPLRAQRPRQARFCGATTVLSHRGVGDLQAGGDLTVAQLQLVHEPEHLSNLTHGQPLLGHRSPLVGVRQEGTTGGRYRRLSSDPYPICSTSGVDTICRNGRTACSGISGQHAPE
jgi:hypothetical protein